MRSRDGNRNFSLSVSIIFLLLSPVLNAGEYFISYRYLVKNFLLYNEQLNISKSMHSCQGKPYNPLLLERDETKDLKTIILQNREKFLEYLHTLGLSITHKDETLNYVHHSLTTITLKAKCFKVDFNDNFVKISPLK